MVKNAVKDQVAVLKIVIEIAKSGPWFNVLFDWDCGKPLAARIKQEFLFFFLHFFVFHPSTYGVEPVYSRFSSACRFA